MDKDQFVKWLLIYFLYARVKDILIMGNDIGQNLDDNSPLTEENIIQAIQRIDQNYHITWINGEMDKFMEASAKILKN